MAGSDYYPKNGQRVAYAVRFTLLKIIASQPHRIGYVSEAQHSNLGSAGKRIERSRLHFDRQNALAPRGRERAISLAATAFSPASVNLTAAADLLAHISVRTLLPLANHVRAVLASRNADLEGSGGRNLDGMPVEQDGLTRTAATPVAAASRRDPTSAGAARGTARATSAAAVRPGRGEPSC